MGWQRQKFVGGDRFGAIPAGEQDNGWKIANEFNVHNSGLGANRVNAIALWAVAKPIAISMGDAGETNLWVGTPCCLSCYSY
jgi:hypothetical protein